LHLLVIFKAITMFNKAPFSTILIVCLFAAACSPQMKKQMEQNLAARSQRPAIVEENSKCRPREGLARGLSGNRANYNCTFADAPDYMRGHGLSEKMYKLKEKRRRAEQELSQEQYTLKRLRYDLREAPADSQRAVILRGEVAVGATEVENKKFKIRIIDSKIQPVRRDVENFKSSHT
jgi:hypothetical protein